MTQDYRHTPHLGGAYEHQNAAPAPSAMRAERGYDRGVYATDEAQFSGYTVGSKQQIAHERPHLGAAQWGGGIVSLALVVGLGVWGYSLMMRDVNGVPVIRAMEGSARVVPEDPGGELAMHQGLAVNTVTADGSAAAPADRLALAPRDIELSDEDQPMAEGQPVLTEYTTQTASLEAADVAPEAAPAQTPEELALAEIEEVVAAEVAETPKGPMAISPVPRPRPRRMAAASSAPAVSNVSLDGVAGDILAAVAGDVAEQVTSNVAPGTRLVQFGAFQSADEAKSEWGRLTTRFPDLMAGKAQVIETSESGGKTFYRLRAQGFSDAPDANRFCAAMTAMKAQCVPTVQR